MAYDLFISYARRDNTDGRITELKAQIEADHRLFSAGELNCFFDREDIRGMDDWRHRILGALRESHLLLLVLSPAYLASPHCEWEVIEFLKYEHSRAVGGQGVTPVYFVEIPGLEEPGFEQRAAAWFARIRRRNQIDLRPWHDEGAACLRRGDVRLRLDDLNQAIHARLTRLRSLQAAPGNLPPHNPRFVGRETELQRLHEATGLGRFGVLTAVQGVGGVGKTSLAIQYAHAYADFYPGGRWMTGCAGSRSLAAALRHLDADLGVVFTEDENRDDTRAARRIVAELERRAQPAGATAKVLLLLDNVDAPDLLQPPQSDLIAGRPWLHVLATTRHAAGDFASDPSRLTVLPVDELPVDDAVRLLESYQPGGAFRTPADRTAAVELAGLLGGFTLAVEVAAVHLGERAGRVPLPAFVTRLRREGLAGLDEAARAVRSGVEHGEKLVGATLRPTWATLAPDEKLVLGLAALLPPDSVPLPWLREVAAVSFPELGRDAEPGYDDPWLAVVNRLLGLRLLQTVDLSEDGHAPRLARLHRLVGEFIRAESGAVAAGRTADLCALARRAAERIGYGWDATSHRWEIVCLVRFAQLLLDRGDLRGAELIAALGFALVRLPLGLDAGEVLGRALAAGGPTPTPVQAELEYHLGELLGRYGHYSEAEPLIRASAAHRHELLGPDRFETWLSENNIGWLLMLRDDYAGAEPYVRRALAGLEATIGRGHHHTLAVINNVAVIESRRGDRVTAKALYEEVLAGMTAALGEAHPDTQYAACNLAHCLDHLGLTAEAGRLFQSSLEHRRAILGEDHPETLESASALAGHYIQLGEIDRSVALYRSVAERRGRTLGWGHPDTQTAVENFVGVLVHLGRTEEARDFLASRIRSLAARPEAESLRLRELALEAFQLGVYPLAEELLQRLVARKFEPASTHHHLARLALVTDRADEFRAHSATALGASENAAPYLPARIFWMQMAFVLKTAAPDDSPREFFVLLGLLKHQLSQPGVQHPWVVGPLLDHLRPRVSAERLALLAALAAALNDPAKVAALDEDLLWRNTAPVPL